MNLSDFFGNISVITIILILFTSYTLSQLEDQRDQRQGRSGRRPTRIDRVLCRQNNDGSGIRASAVFNRNGEVCKTYCRVVNRRNGTAAITEFNAPNNVRCGPRPARCIDGICTLSGIAETPRPQRRRSRRPVTPGVDDNNTRPTRRARRPQGGRRRPAPPPTGGDVPPSDPPGDSPGDDSTTISGELVSGTQDFVTLRESQDDDN